MKKFFFVVEGDNEEDLHTFNIFANTYEQAREKAFKKYFRKTGKEATGICGSIEV